jgi:hypothetical protein
MDEGLIMILVERKSLIKLSVNRSLAFLISFMLLFLLGETSSSSFDRAVIESNNEIGKIIKKDFSNCRLVQLRDLYDDLQNYFKKTYPDLHPGYVYGDFNGDGITDYALLIRCKDHNSKIEKFIVFIGQGKESFSTIVIDQWNDELSLKNLFLSIIQPGKIREGDSSKIKILKFQGIKLSLFEAASRVYFWDNNKFSFIQTSD